MKKARLAELIGEVQESFVEEAMPLHKERKTHWVRWAALAACACLVLAIGLTGSLWQTRSDSAMDPGDAPAMGEPTDDSPAELPTEPAKSEAMPESELEEPEESMIPHVEVDGTTYYISSHLSSYAECPEGFVYEGEIAYGDFAGCAYYRNADHPQLVYVYTMTNNDGRLDASGTVIPTEWHMAYMRFADETMRGRDYICVDGVRYVSLWSAYGVVPWAFADRITEEYGARIEGELPEGFVSAGVTEFVGWDIWPTGMLSSNQGEMEVYVHPEIPDVILAAASWQSAKGKHHGFDVYILSE